MDSKVMKYLKVLASTMSNNSDTEGMRGKTGKRKISAYRLDHEEMPSEPDRKLGRTFKITDLKSSRRHVATHCGLSGSAAGLKRAEITDGRGYESEPEGHASDEHRCVDGGEEVTEQSSVDNNSDVDRSFDDCEQVTEHSSVENNSDGDSVKCPICSVTFTTQEVATPDTCDHTFCAACLQELTQTENNCPVDKRMFNFILVRHHVGGKIMTYIPVEPGKRQGQCNREEQEHLCCQYTLAHGWLDCSIVARVHTGPLGPWYAVRSLIVHSSRQSSM
jgi:hypothetical protein